MRLPIALLLVAACTPAKPDWTFQGTDQVCSMRVPASRPGQADVLLVIDDSWAAVPLQERIGTELGRAIDLQLGRGTTAWLHIGVVTADPNDGARLIGGCGIADERPWVDYQRGAVSNLEPGRTVGSVVSCLGSRAGTAGLATQQPMTLAARLLSGDIPEARGFRRPGAAAMIVFLTGADYPEDGQPLLDASGPDRYDYIFESVAPPSAHLDPVVGAAPDHVQLPFEATDWTPLFDWYPKITELLASSCLYAPPSDLDHLDFVVEDVTYLDNGNESAAELPACSTTSWQPTCWQLIADDRCFPSGLRFDVQRPIEGAPPNTTTRLTWDCAAGR